MPPAEVPRGGGGSAAHAQRTASDCYDSFPAEVKASCPLEVPFEDLLSSGALAEGPGSGSRARPPAEVAHAPRLAKSEDEVQANCKALSARGHLH